MWRSVSHVLSLMCIPFLGAAQESPAVTPAEVYQSVAVLRGEVNLIRLEMGKPVVEPPIIQVRNAAPREVYFEAISLFQKANRLGVEITGEQVEEPVMAKGELEPGHVLKVVKESLKRLALVKAELNIPEETKEPPVEENIDPSQVFNAIMSANRELNQLLDRRFAPGDVFLQVSVAIAYAARLLDEPEGQLSTPPPPPPLERRKRPADVYRGLVVSFESIRKIGELSGVEMLSFKVDEEQLIKAEPNDVYDMATLMVAELAYLHSLRSNARPPRKAYYPGSKLPSEVFQRIGILGAQMEMLRLRVEENPDWLKNE